MTDKIVKNEQWPITELIYRINKAGITKPKFQRKKKWTKLPLKKKTAPNEKDYINFLFEHCNSVAAITFGQDTINNEIKLSNIDGNNRINAISNFAVNVRIRLHANLIRYSSECATRRQATLCQVAEQSRNIDANCLSCLMVNCESKQQC